MRRCIANKSLEKWASYREGDEIPSNEPTIPALVALGHARWVDDLPKEAFTEHGQRRRGRPTNAEREARRAAEVGAVTTEDFEAARAKAREQKVGE